jgi:hypothetical protein
VMMYMFYQKPSPENQGIKTASGCSGQLAGNIKNPAPKIRGLRLVPVFGDGFDIKNPAPKIKGFRIGFALWAIKRPLIVGQRDPEGKLAERLGSACLK